MKGSSTSRASQPVILPARKVPFSAREKFKAELKRLWDLEIIALADERTEWYSFQSVSGLIFTTAQVVFITARIALIFTSLSAVQIYDFHIFTVVYWPLHRFIWNQHNDQFPVGLLAQLVERCTDIANVATGYRRPAWARKKDLLTDLRLLQWFLWACPFEISFVSVCHQKVKGSFCAPRHTWATGDL